MNVELVKSALQGDDEALILCLQSISDQLTWTAVSLLGDRELAKDCIMETTLKVYKKRKTVKKPEFFKTWVIRILINDCKDELKRSKNYISLDEHFEIASSEKENFDYVNDLVAKLPLDLKQIIVLKFFDEMNFREIGEVLKTPESTVKSRYAVALKKLRMEMEEYEQ